MRISLRPMFATALAACVAWAVCLSTFVCDLAVRVGFYIRETLVWASDFIPRLEDMPQPIRRIWMSATALNGRQVGGVRIPGFLGRPAVRMLTG